IAQELGEAFAETWIAADQPSRDAWLAMRALIGGSEDDAVRAEETIRGARFREPLRISQALRKKLSHEARTGHKVAGARTCY
ncbi:MAG: hypothetical protein WAN14_12060, partial [Candidatus Acidiferrales bacterium]